MFYNEATITFLEKRIGWPEIMPPTTIVISDTDLINGTSNRKFNYFSKFAIIENVYDAIVNANATSVTLEEQLSELRNQAALSALNDVFDSDERAYYFECAFGNRIDISNKDYSDRIQSNARLFDNAVGYGVALKTVELLLSSSRINATNRSNKFTESELMTELHGLRNKDGKVLEMGLMAKYSIEIKKIIEILFPKVITPKLRFRRIW